MPKLCVPAVVLALFVTLSLPNCATAQAEGIQNARRIGVAAKISSLGVGAEVATPLTARSNLRTGFNAFAYDHSIRKDGTVYTGHLNLRSLQANYDWFPFGGSFHISPGLLVYNGNRVRASYALAAEAAAAGLPNPITGNGKIEFRKVAPMLLVGWGNLLHRGGKRFSIPFEFGFVYHGSPRASLSMDKIVCDASDINCQMAGADPSLQSSLRAEEISIRRDISPFKFYPVVSVGFGYSF